MARNRTVLIAVVRVAAVAVDLIVAAVLLGLWVEQVKFPIALVTKDPGWSLFVLLVVGATLTVAATRIKGWAEQRQERSTQEREAAERLAAETREAEQTYATARTAYLAELRVTYANVHLELLAPEGQSPPQHRQVPLRAAFVPQWVREKLPAMEMSKDLQRQLVETGAIDAADLPADPGFTGLRHAASTAREQPPLPVLTVLGDVSQRLLVLLGNPGSGKSALARYLALTLAGEPNGADSELRALDGMLPIVVELGKYADPRWRAGSFLDLIDHQHQTEGLGLPKTTVQQYLLRGGQAVVIFDGLDEVTHSQVHQAVTREIAAFARRHPQVRVVVTSRPTGYRHAVLEAAGFAHYELDDLTREQIGAFVTGWYALTCPHDPKEAVARRQRLLAAVDESPSLRELAANPMLLTILSLVGGQGDLPRDRGGAYAQAAELLVAHWDVERDVRKASGLRDIKWHDKLAMLQRAARRIQGNRTGLGGNRVTGVELVHTFEEYLRDQHHFTAKQAMRTAQALLSDFHKRSFVFSYFGDDEYGFAHQAFLEYFTATDVVARLRAEELTVDELVAQIYRPHWAEPAWHEVLVLISGMVEAAPVGRIVDFLVDADPLWFASGERVPRHILLAVRCLGENRHLRELPRHGSRLAQAVISICEHARYNDTRSSPALESLHAVVLPVWAAVGVQWPGRHLFLSWFLVRARWMSDTRAVPSFPGALPVGAVATMLAGAVFAADPSVRAVLVADAVHAVDPLLRLAALHALAAGWPEDRHTLALVRARAATDTDPDVRQAALQAMSAGWPTDPATQVLMRDRAVLDPDGEVRQAAVQLLVGGWADRPEVLDLALERVVNDDHGSVRLAAVRGLTARGVDHPTVLPLSRVLAKGDPDPQVRRAALQGLVAVGRHDPELPTLLCGQAVEDPHPAVRRAAIQLLAGRWRDDPKTLAVVRVRATADDDWQVRQAAVVAMAGGWSLAPGTMALVRDRICEDEHPAVRRTALEALAAQWGTDAATLTLVRERVEQDEDWTVRRAALQALATWWRDDPRTPQLVGDRAAHDAVAAVRQAAVQALVAGWPEADATAAALRERAGDDPDEDVRRVAVQVIAAMAPHDGRLLALTLAKATDDEGWTVRRAAVRGLGAHCREDPRTVGCVRDRATGDADPAVRRGAVHVLSAGWAPDPATVALVRDITTADADWAVRRSSLQLLVAGWQDVAETHELVRDRTMGDDHPGVRQAAVQLLVAGWRDARDTLRVAGRQAGNDPDWAVRRAALRALAAGWPDSPISEAIVRDRAVTDPDVDVRRAALQALATSWGNAPATETLIADRLSADPDMEVREAALRLLVSGWRNSPPTLNLTHERATHDEHPKVRHTARQLLRAAWPNHPIVLGLRDVGPAGGAVAGEV